MTEPTTLSGVLPVLPTIFDRRGNLDLDGLGGVIDYAIDAGVDGLVFPGLASEYDCLTLEERDLLVTFVGERIAGRVAFVVGASSDDAATSVRLAAAGADAGASGAMIMTPRNLAGDHAGLADFYREVGKASALRLMVQNAPAPMGLGLSAAQVVDIARGNPAISWVKEENMPCGQRISDLLAADVQLEGVFGGAGGRYIVDELVRGAIGSMPAAETPEVHVALMCAARASDLEEVRRLYEALLPILLMQAVFRWRLTKEVLLRRGLIKSTFTRAAGPEMDQTDKQELGLVLERLERATQA